MNILGDHPRLFAIMLYEGLHWHYSWTEKRIVKPGELVRRKK